MKAVRSLCNNFNIYLWTTNTKYTQLQCKWARGRKGGIYFYSDLCKQYFKVPNLNFPRCLSFCWKVHSYYKCNLVKRLILAYFLLHLASSVFQEESHIMSPCLHRIIWIIHMQREHLRFVFLL